MLKIYIYLTIIISLSATITATSQTVSYGVFNERCYIAVSDSLGFDWNEANLLSASYGGGLAVINDLLENNFVAELTSEKSEYWTESDGELLGAWIGGFQESGAAEPSEGWNWINGEDFDYTNWAPGKPDEFNNSNENRICYYGENEEPSAYWNDYPNSKKLKAFVVEIGEVATADAGSDKYIEIGGDAKIGGSPSASGVEPPYNYSWRPAYNISDPNSPNPTVSPEHTTEYILKVTPDLGCPVYDTVVVRVKSPIMQVSRINIKDLICKDYSDNHFTITNIGGETLIIRNINIEGAGSANFELLGDFQQISLDSNESESYTIQFKPQSPGLKSATVRVTSNSNPDSSQTFPVSGMKYEMSFSTDKDLIDFGELCLNELKDASFTIKNNGTVDVGLKLVTSNKFELSRYETLLRQGESKNIDVRFNGWDSNIDINSQIKIIDTVCDVIENVDLKVKISEPEIEAEELTIYSPIGGSATDMLTVRNVSDMKVQLKEPTISDPRFKIVNETFPKEIKRYDETQIQIEYTPTDMQLASVQLDLEGAPCDVSATITVFGQAVEKSAEITVGSVNAKPGENIFIPIYVSDLKNIFEDDSIVIYTELIFNSNLLYPTGNTPLGSDTAGMRAINITFPLKPESGALIAEFEFLAMLGDTDFTELQLNEANTYTENGSVRLSFVPGGFNLKGVCREGGDRFIVKKEIEPGVALFPNPAETYLTIKSATKKIEFVAIRNALGAEIKSKHINAYERTIPINELSAGVYLIEIIFDDGTNETESFIKNR